MEEKNRNEEPEQTLDSQSTDQTDTQQEAPKSAALKQKIAVHKNILGRKKTPVRTPRKAGDSSSTSTPEADTAPEKKLSVRAAKSPAKTSETSLKTQKPAKTTTLRSKAEMDQKTKAIEKADPEKAQKEKIKVKKKKDRLTEEKVDKFKSKVNKAKVAEVKADKLKVKVKKAKKKDSKPSKLKSLKDKLNKAIEKFKSRVRKLKKGK